MPNQHLYLIYQCQNTACRLRFPKPDNEQVIVSCPACGEPLSLVEESFTNHKPDTINHAGNNFPITVAVAHTRQSQPHSQRIQCRRHLPYQFQLTLLASATFISMASRLPHHNPKIQKTSLSTEFAVPWTHHKNGFSLDHIHAIKNQFQIWAVEGGQNASSIFDIHIPQSDCPVLLIFGSEYAGIDPAILQLADRTIFIPMIGFCPNDR